MTYTDEDVERVIEQCAAILDGEAIYFIQEREKAQASAFKRFGPDERKGDAYWNSTEMQTAAHWGAKRDATENAAGLIRKLKSALPRQALQDGWQTMETAPKDGKARLIWCPENQCTYCVSWGKYYHGDDEHEGWLVFGGGYRTGLLGATHWRPLPAPPQQDKP